MEVMPLASAIYYYIDSGESIRNKWEERIVLDLKYFFEALLVARSTT